MKMLVKYKVLLLGLICLGIPRCVEAQEKTGGDADTTKNVVLSVLQKEKDWSDIYSMRSMFLFGD